jgi:hypothetical protein
MKIFGDRSLRGALAGMLLLGAVTQSGCLEGGSDAEMGGAKPDLNVGSAVSPTARKGAQAVNGGTPAGDDETPLPAQHKTCKEAAQCASGFCVDGVCCNEACTGTCVSCNQAQSPGTCLPVSGAEDEAATEACAGANICTVAADGQPACKLKSGQPCATNAECASGSCGSIVVPPDPANPYDTGYTYVGCE